MQFSTPLPGQDYPNPPHSSHTKALKKTPLHSASRSLLQPRPPRKQASRKTDNSILHTEYKYGIIDQKVQWTKNLVVPQ